MKLGIELDEEDVRGLDTVRLEVLKLLFDSKYVLSSANEDFDENSVKVELKFHKRCKL